MDAIKHLAKTVRTKLVETRLVKTSLAIACTASKRCLQTGLARTSTANKHCVQGVLANPRRTRTKIAHAGLKALLTAALMITPCLYPAAAFADTNITKTYFDGESTTKTKYFWREGELPPLTDVEVVLDTDSAQTTREHSAKLTKQIAISDINYLEQIFPQTCLASEGDFYGEIELDRENPYTIVPLYETQTAQVDKQATILGLPDNDAIRIPITKHYLVRSASALGASQEVELLLSSIDYELVEKTELGRPCNWTAYVVYRGVEEFLVLKAYEVTAHYRGTITNKALQYAAYSPQQSPKGIEGITVTDSTVPLFVPAAVIICAGIAVIVAALLLWLFLFRKNICLVKRVGKVEQIVFKKHIRVHEGLAKLAIPDVIDIFSAENDYALLLKPELAAKRAFIDVIWRGHLIAKRQICGRIDLSKQAFIAFSGLELESILEVFVPSKDLRGQYV
ncbi:hypothetical protein FACS1894185_4020 [Betaproteobacteria bacterium]|nr:hypothetical protein FACS1894185_4020 [Betaproteobacteria bacterium]